MAIPVYEYLTLKFTVSRALIETAMIDSNQFRVVIAKVMCYSLLIFSMIAIFEATVINGTRLLLNAVLWLFNTSNDLIFSSSGQITIELPPPIPPLPILKTGQERASTLDEPLPPMLPAEEEIFSSVFEILGTAGWIELGLKTPYLIKSRDQTKHLHPLQVIGYLLKKNSKQREHCASFFRSDMLRDSFISQTLEGFANPTLAAKTDHYIASFAEKIEVEPDIVRRFLLQNPPALQDFVNYVLRTK